MAILRESGYIAILTEWGDSCILIKGGNTFTAGKEGHGSTE